MFRLLSTTEGAKEMQGIVCQNCKKLFAPGEKVKQGHIEAYMCTECSHCNYPDNVRGKLSWHIIGD